MSKGISAFCVAGWMFFFHKQAVQELMKGPLFKCPFSFKGLQHVSNFLWQRRESIKDGALVHILACSNCHSRFLWIKGCTKMLWMVAGCMGPRHGTRTILSVEQTQCSREPCQAAHVKHCSSPSRRSVHGFDFAKGLGASDMLPALQPWAGLGPSGRAGVPTRASQTDQRWRVPFFTSTAPWLLFGP